MITEKQNNIKNLQRLAAQRQLYATAKKIFAFHIIISAPVVIAFSLVVMIIPSANVYASLWGALVALADFVILTPMVKQLRGNGAKVQEVFDCDVLDIPWNELKAGEKPSHELIKEQSDKYAKWAKTMPPLTDWYSPSVSELPLKVGRIVCQRSNCWWDAKQRRYYAATIILSVSTVFVVVFLVALIGDFTLKNFLLNVLFPLLPLLILGARQFRDNQDTANRLDTLKSHADRIWKKALDGSSESDLLNESRNLQDEIYDNRRNKPLIFDTIFRRLRPSLQTQMNFGSDELVSEAKAKLAQ